MSKNIVDKIWEAHRIQGDEGAPDMIFMDLQLLHEVTSPQAFTELRNKNLRVFDPSRNVATLDHSIPTNPTQDDFGDEQNKIQLNTHRKIIGSVGGIETMDILTPYRFRIAVAKLFVDREVMSKVKPEYVRK